MSDGGKSFLVDVSRCTGCRGCQIACKQWNELPGTKTVQTGSYQNPPDFNEHTYKVVRFSEGRDTDNKPYWYFFSDMCRHCINPPCLAGMVNDEMIHDDPGTGAVVYTADTNKSDFETARESCPFDIPRQDPQTKVLTKCTMCIDRITEGMLPACALSCPTEAIIFGERADILKKVEKRVSELKKHWPKAKALNVEDCRVIYIVTDDPEKFHKFAEGK